MPQNKRERSVSTDASEKPLDDLLKNLIREYRDDAHMMGDDPRWGLELLVADLMDACEQLGQDFEAILQGGRLVREERQAQGFEPPCYV